MKTYEKNLEIILTVEMLRFANAVLDMGSRFVNILGLFVRDRRYS